MTMRLQEKKGEAVMLVIMGVMMVGGLILWLTRGEFHMMPMQGKGHNHMNAKTGSSPHGPRGRAPDSSLDPHGADHSIKEEPVLDNP